MVQAAGKITILEPALLAQEAIEAGTAKGATPPEPGSINEAVAAVAEAGAEGVTAEMKAALVQQRLIKDMEEDIAAAQAAAEAADPDAAAADSEEAGSPARSYLFVGGPVVQQRCSYLQTGMFGFVVALSSITQRGLLISARFSQNPWMARSLLR